MRVHICKASKAGWMRTYLMPSLRSTLSPAPEDATGALAAMLDRRRWSKVFGSIK